ncbi:MAG: hypothetical protein MUO76_03945, partial [Anaerolineaceae bacterium]|nr:hypothetical protein [Anaerolineaceae bacterium]
LSPTEITQFSALIRRVNKKLAITIIIIEHFMKALAGLSNRLMILQNGRKISLAHPDEVLKDRRVIECYLGTGNYA